MGIGTQSVDGVDGGHALDQERFDAIVEWIVDRVSDQ
jgi:hypothetical protein